MFSGYVLVINARENLKPRAEDPGKIERPGDRRLFRGSRIGYYQNF
jgi:hypothetical protein